MKMNKQKSLLFIVGVILFILQGSTMYAQENQDTLSNKAKQEHKPRRRLSDKLRIIPPPIRELKEYGKDQNHAWECLYDTQLPEWADRCYAVTGEYIGPYPFGVDLYAMNQKSSYKNDFTYPYTVRGIGPEGDSIVVEKKPYDKYKETTTWDTIGGHAIEEFIELTPKDSVWVDLMTLDELREWKFPTWKGPFVYMINKFIILENADLYKIDRNFLYKMEVITSDKIETLKDYPPFTIIRFLTRTHHNWHPSRMGTF